MCSTKFTLCGFFRYYSLGYITTKTISIHSVAFISLNDSILALLWLHPWHHKWENWSGLLWLSNYCDGNGGVDGIENCIANNNNDDYDDDDIYWRDNWSDRLWESDSSLLLPPMEKTKVSGFLSLNPCLIWFNLLMKEDIM